MTSTFEIDFPNKTLYRTTSPDGATLGLGTSTFRTSPACRATPCGVKAPTPKLRGARRRPPKPCGSGGSDGRATLKKRFCEVMALKSFL